MRPNWLAYRIYALLICLLSAGSWVEARAGGESGGGGGNTRQPIAASPAMVQKAILDSQTWLPFIFNHLEFELAPTESSSSLEKSAFEKLFGRGKGPSPISEAIAKIRLTTPESGPCISPLGEEDGAGFADGRVCLSQKRILGKVNGENVFIKTAALFSREASHIAGLTEEESDIVQDSVESTLHSSLSFASVSSIINELFIQVYYLNGAIESALQTLDQGKPTTLQCLALGAIGPQVTAVNDTGAGRKRYGVSLLPRKLYYYYYDALNFKIGMSIHQFCGSENDPLFASVFRGKTRISIEEGLRNQLSNASRAWILERHLPIDNVFVQRIKPADKGALRQQLLESRSLIERLKRELPRSE